MTFHHQTFDTNLSHSTHLSNIQHILLSMKDKHFLLSKKNYRYHFHRPWDYWISYLFFTFNKAVKIEQLVIRLLGKKAKGTLKSSDVESVWAVELSDFCAKTVLFYGRPSCITMNTFGRNPSVQQIFISMKWHSHAITNAQLAVRTHGISQNTAILKGRCLKILVVVTCSIPARMVLKNLLSVKMVYSITVPYALW